jgi:histidyl-tRNA synthetase
MGNSEKKKKRTVPRVPRGFRDLPPGMVAARRRMIDTVCGVYESYGFSPLETPALEYVDVLGKFLPESETPDGGIFSFKYDDDEWVALRYDLTAPLSRYVAKNFQELGMPFRRYQTGPVWRLEKPEPGRYREFTQLDIDIVGSQTVLADAEVACVLADAMEALEIPRGSYQVRMNDRKVLNGVLDSVGVGEDKVGAVLRSLDKLDRLGADGVRLLLGPGREDDSGDFTAGAGLESSAIDRLLAFLEAPKGDRQGYLQVVGDLVGDSSIGQEGLKEMRDLDAILSERGVEADRVVFDTSIVRGLAYYTGPVVEVALTFGEGGKQFGSVAGGGRYDGLVGRFMGQPVPATGASIGVDRLLTALDTLGKIEARAGVCPVLVTTMDKRYRADYQAMAAELRGAGISCELYVGGGGVGKQFKYADRRGFSAVVVAGEDELGRGQVSIKDLRLGQELSSGAEFQEDRRAWLEALPGQIEVPRTELVAKVREVLARYEPGIGT